MRHQEIRILNLETAQSAAPRCVLRQHLPCITLVVDAFARESPNTKVFHQLD
tara:strand:- start:26672 stop:26827 length:156 start_codon:yes stop_codon:yes gene_type:complete